MPTLPQLSIRPTPHGPVLCLNGKWRKEFAQLPGVDKIVGVEVSSFKDEHEPNLEFLQELPAIRYFGSLYSFPFDYSYLYRIHTLNSLKFLTLRLSSLDFRRFPNLESAVVPWHSALASIFDCHQLKALSLLGCREKTSRRLAQLSSIEALKLKDCSFGDLDAFPEMARLRKLQIGLPRLMSLEPLSKCTRIEWLWVSQCGKIANYDVFGRLGRLRGLMIDTERKTPSLEFVESLSQMRLFNFSLAVQDGKLRRLLKCPLLASAHFADRENYDISREELNGILSSTRPPLSCEEDLCFRSFSHGISDWQVFTGPELTVFKSK